MSTRSNGFTPDGRRLAERLFDGLEDALGEVRTWAQRRWPRAFGYGPNWQPVVGAQRGAAAGIVNAARAARQVTPEEKWLEGWEAGSKLAFDHVRELEDQRLKKHGAGSTEPRSIDVYSRDLEDRLRRDRASLERWVA
jgi:hypothetical protein